MLATKMASSSLRAKTNILAKLKKQVQGADYSKLPTEPSVSYPKLSHQQQVAQFITYLETNHAQVITVKKEDIANVIQAQLKARNIDQLLVGKNSPCSDIVEQLVFCGDCGDGVEDGDDSLSSEKNGKLTVQAYDFQLTDNKERVFNDCPAALTSSYGAISATGTIVLWPSAEEPRTLSLIPPLHIVIVDANKMFDDFASLVKKEHWQDNLPTNVLLISGPSKTADIQQTLAYGAHGPKELIVLLINTVFV